MWEILYRWVVNGFSLIKRLRCEVIAREGTQSPLREDEPREPRWDGCRTWGGGGWLSALPNIPPALCPHQANTAKRSGLSSPRDRAGKAHPCPATCAGTARPSSCHGERVLAVCERIRPGLNESKHPRYCLGSLTWAVASPLPQGSCLGKITPVYIHQMPNTVSLRPEQELFAGSPAPTCHTNCR